VAANYFLLSNTSFGCIDWIDNTDWIEDDGIASIDELRIAHKYDGLYSLWKHHSFFGSSGSYS
jgi:hypothetical protein